MATCVEFSPGALAAEKLVLFILLLVSAIRALVKRITLRVNIHLYLLFFVFPISPFFLKEEMFDSKVPDSLSISESPDFI